MHVAHVCGDAGLDADPDAKRDTFDAACLAPRVHEEQGPTDADPFEPNDTFVMASVPAKGAECDITKKPKTAMISGAGDVDVFRTGECTASDLPLIASGPIFPWAEIGADGLRVCVFPTCSDGSLHIEGCYATDLTKAADPTKDKRADEVITELGFHGCCRNDSGRITAYIDCPRDSPKLDTYIMVDTGGDKTTTNDTTYDLRWKIDY